MPLVTSFRCYLERSAVHVASSFFCESLDEVYTVIRTERRTLRKGPRVASNSQHLNSSARDLDYPQAL